MSWSSKDITHTHPTLPPPQAVTEYVYGLHRSMHSEKDSGRFLTKWNRAWSTYLLIPLKGPLI